MLIKLPDHPQQMRKLFAICQTYTSYIVPFSIGPHPFGDGRVRLFKLGSVICQGHGQRSDPNKEVLEGRRCSFVGACQHHNPWAVPFGDVPMRPINAVVD